jgi:tetratricopeptide (TPR) repeat protein
MRLITFDGRLTSSDADASALSPDQLFGAIGFYAERLFVPRDFLAYYASVPDSPRNIAIGVLATLAWLVAFALAVRMRQRAVAVGLVWTAATLAPSLPVFVANASIAPVAERYAFLPSAGLAICVASIFADIARRITEAPPRIRTPATAAAAFACVALAAVFALQTSQRIGDWKDLETLLEATIDDAPGAGIPHVYLAHVHARAGRIDETRAEFLAATVGEMPDVSRHAVWYEYAAWLDANGFSEESWAAYREAIALDPRSVLARRDFAASLWRYATRPEMQDDGVLASALAEAELAVEIDPERVETLVLLATIARDLGDTTRARSAFEQALEFEDSDDTRQRIRLQLDSLPE